MFVWINVEVAYLPINSLALARTVIRYLVATVTSSGDEKASVVDGELWCGVCRPKSIRSTYRATDACLLSSVPSLLGSDVLSPSSEPIRQPQNLTLRFGGKESREQKRKESGIPELRDLHDVIIIVQIHCARRSHGFGRHTNMRQATAQISDSFFRKNLLYLSTSSSSVFDI